MQPSTARADPNYGRGTHTIADDDASSLDGLEPFLSAFIARPGLELPRPPSVALEIHHLSSKPDTTIDQIATLVGREPVLAARIVRMANSPIYRGTAPSTNVKQALVRVGLKSAHDLILDAAMRMTVIRAEGFEQTLDHVRRHSSAVAWLAQLVSKTARVEMENAFLIGLFHDLGISVGLVALCEYLKQKKRPVALRGDSWELLMRAHERLGGALLEKWQLAPSIATVVARHHTLNDFGKPHRAVAVHMVAESLATRLGWGVAPALARGELHYGASSTVEGQGSEVLDAALAAIGLTREKLEALSKDAEQLLLMLDAQFKD